MVVERSFVGIVVEKGGDSGICEFGGRNIFMKPPDGDSKFRYRQGFLLSVNMPMGKVGVCGVFEMFGFQSIFEI